MKKTAVLAALAAVLGGCAALLDERGEPASDFEKQTQAADLRAREDKVRVGLGQIEAAIADYYKEQNRIPAGLDELVPKYMAAVPFLDLPACGPETNRVELYTPAVLRDGRVDGARLRGTGRWGYVFNDRRVIVFVDCLKPSSLGAPWYQARGLY